MFRIFLVLAALAALSWSFFFHWERAKTQATPVGNDFSERRIALLERENERLRALVSASEQARTAAAAAIQRKEIEQAVEGIREVRFTKPVDYKVLGRTEIQGVISRKMSEVYSEADFLHLGAAYARLGLLPADFPLRQTFVDLLGEQVAAFYDQHTGGLYMFADATLQNAQNRIVLAHELTHALTDQHFSLAKLPLETKTNDDQASAASALVEGDATVVMSAYMLQNLSLGALKDNLSAAVGQDMKLLQRAPRFLRETLVFPYLRGQEFCSALMAEGGWDAINDAYANPPASTSQILHPRKYLDHPREDPLRVPGEPLSIRGKPPTVDNVLGEFAIRIHLAETLGDEHPAARTAEGWRGDRYLAWGRGEALVWQTLWSSESEAAEFFAAEQLVLEKRYRPAKARRDTDLYEVDAPRYLRLVREGLGVRLVDVPDAAWGREVEGVLR